jgi:hypothetical protein
MPLMAGIFEMCSKNTRVNRYPGFDRYIKESGINRLIKPGNTEIKLGINRGRIRVHLYIGFIKEGVRNT